MQKIREENQNMFICFSGIDGSGKSTYATMLLEYLHREEMKVKYVWMRMNYMLTRPVLLLCRLVGLTKRPSINGTKISVHEFYKAPKIGKLVQYFHMVDTYIAYFFKIYIPMKLGYFVIVDRFIYDIIIDYSVENREYDIFKKNIYKFLSYLNKKGLTFLIHAPKNLIISRRPDVIIYDKDFDQRYDMYQELQQNKDIIVIDNSKEINKNFMIILKKIRLKREYE